MALEVKTTTQPSGTAIYVDSTESLQSFIQEVIKLTEHSKTIFLDLEGVRLSRDGTVSLLTLLILDNTGRSHVFLVDIHTLGSSAFTLAATCPFRDQPICFKEILESSQTTKVFWDVRNDADALHSHFGVRLQNATDLQLMEHAARVSAGQGSRFVHGLAKCVRADSTLSAEAKRAWDTSKERGQRLFAPEKGGRYEIFNERPLQEEIKNYYQQDVLCLPNLYEVYRSKLQHSKLPNWDTQVRQQTEKRLQDCMSARYQPHGAQKAFAPQWEGGSSRWDEWDDDYF